MSSIKRRDNGKWRARYRDDTGKEHARHFERRVDAQGWLDQQTARLVGGTHISPRTARATVSEWAETWLAGYGTRRPSVKSARIHLFLIIEHFGDMQLAAVRPSH